MEKKHNIFSLLIFTIPEILQLVHALAIAQSLSGLNIKQKKEEERDGSLTQKASSLREAY